MTGYVRTTLWNTTKAGFSVDSSKVVAADINGDGRDELVVLTKQGSRGARLLCFAWNGKKLRRTTLWSAHRAPFGVTSASIAAGDLNHDGKTDLLVLSRSGRRATLRGFLSSGRKLTAHWHWAGHMRAGTRLACGVPTGSARFAAWLVSPTSASKAALYALKAGSRGFTAHRVWSGSLRLRGAQLGAVDLAGAGPVDLLVFGPRGTGWGHHHDAAAPGQRLRSTRSVDHQGGLCGHTRGAWLRTLAGWCAGPPGGGPAEQQHRQACRRGPRPLDHHPRGHGSRRRRCRQGACRRPHEPRSPGNPLPGHRSAYRWWPDHPDHHSRFPRPSLLLARSVLLPPA